MDILDLKQLLIFSFRPNPLISYDFRSAIIEASKIMDDALLKQPFLSHHSCVLKGRYCVQPSLDTNLQNRTFGINLFHGRLVDNYNN